MSLTWLPDEDQSRPTDVLQFNPKDSVFFCGQQGVHYGRCEMLCSHDKVALTEAEWQTDGYLRAHKVAESLCCTFRVVAVRLAAWAKTGLAFIANLPLAE